MFFIDFDGCCCDFEILGSDFDILCFFLGFGGLWGKCAVCVFHLSLNFTMAGHFAESRFFSFSRHKTNPTFP